MRFAIIVFLLFWQSPCFSQAKGVYLREDIDFYKLDPTVSIDTSSLLQFDFSEGTSVAFDFKVIDVTFAQRLNDDESKVIFISYIENDAQTILTLTWKSYKCTVEKRTVLSMGGLIKASNEIVNVWLLSDNTIVIECLTFSGPEKSREQNIIICGWSVEN